MYLGTTRTEEVPGEETVEETTPPSSDETSTEQSSGEDGEAVVEDVNDTPETTLEEVGKVKMKTVVIEEWSQANPQPPIWMRFVSAFGL